MSTLNCTHHAKVRIRQRGLSEADLSLIVECGTQVAPDAVSLTARDAQREIERRKREIGILERLRDCKVIVEGAEVITCYHPMKREQKRTLRKARAYR